jgi:hypothetical protein
MDEGKVGWMVVGQQCATWWSSQQQYVAVRSTSSTAAGSRKAEAEEQKSPAELAGLSLNAWNRTGQMSPGLQVGSRLWGGVITAWHPVPSFTDPTGD